MRRFDATQGPRVVGPHDGTVLDLGGTGVRFMIRGEESGGGFALVEHPIPPGHLAAPLHRHTRMDEYSFVLEGRLGALLGDDVVYAEPGDLAFKPRDQWHTFWNAGETPLPDPRDHLARGLRALFRGRRRRFASARGPRTAIRVARRYRGDPTDMRGARPDVSASPRTAMTRTLHHRISEKEAPAPGTFSGMRPETSPARGRSAP